jgi:sigma-B regulation protein RsbU (phosphoserine phosphatase)
MRPSGPRYIWLKLALAVGSLLGLLLLVQSVITYYQVSRVLVTAELRRDAEQHSASIEREARRLGIRDPVQLGQVLADIRQDALEKIAWVRIIDMSGQTLAQNGTSAGQPFGHERLRHALDGRTPVSEVRQTEAGKVLVMVLSLRLARRPPVEAGPPFPDARPAVRPGVRFVELALYVDSASAGFGRLRRNLVVSSSAALGLLASMMMLWLRLPHYVRGKQLERQTELARQVQTDLLPAAGAVFANLEFSAACVPAGQVGGDFYDVFCGDEGRIEIVLGDVSGKGLPASVVAGLLLGAVRASDWMAGSGEHEASSRRIGEILRTRTSLDRFASMFWCYYEPASQVLRYVNAGHLPPLLVRRNGGGELEFARLTEGGPVLGLLPNADYRQGQTAVCCGDLLVLYSDGVVEAENAAGEQFDEFRVVAAVRQNADSSSAAMRDEILKRVHAFLGKADPQDDLTLIVAQIRD